MAVNRLDDIKRLVNLLVAEAVLKLDCQMYLSNKRKLLIVEGTTDQAFIGKLINELVDCIVAAKVFQNNSQFRTQSSGNISCKNAIVKIIVGISNFPSPFVAYPADLDKWNLFGLVDSDCEELSTCKPLPRLFITDTHDLETLLLSTDGELLTRIEECEISLADVKKAYHIAYQLAYLREELAIYRGDLDLRLISCGSGQVDLCAFVNDGVINLNALVKYIVLKSSNKLPPSKVTKICNSIVSSKTGRKKIDLNGNWKQLFDQFDHTKIPDFWNLVNGHDILQLLQFINEEICSAFQDNGRYTLNRGFEMSLIAAYDYSQFKKTILHQKMLTAGLLKS